MSKVKVEKSIELANRIMKLKKKNLNLITSLINELEYNEMCRKENN